MGLPQEVIERIIGILRDNRGALEACSLTCKAMFASTRHLIHQTLHLKEETNARILTPAEKRRVRKGCHELELRLLSFMGERDLLKYAKHADIRMDFMLSPDPLKPHLRHFRSLDRIHTLTIRLCSADVWRRTYVTQFYPTLTTLALHFLIEDHRNVLPLCNSLTSRI